MIHNACVYVRIVILFFKRNNITGRKINFNVSDQNVKNEYRDEKVGP